MAASDANFWIGRRSATTSRLPYVVRLLVSGEGRIFLAVRDTWPRGTDVFCHQLPAWPDDAEIIEEIPIEACWRAGVAVHLVLRRARQRRSLFVWTRKGERTLVFWRSEASMRRETPGIRVPLDRAPFEPARGGDRGNRVDQSFRGAALWCHAEHCCRRSRGARERGASPHHGRRNETTLRGTIVPDATLPRTRGC